jgi:rare lipoprotein A
MARSHGALPASAALGLAALLTASCAVKTPPVPRPPIPPRPGQTEKGRASWYGPTFHGRTTASGERYNMLDLTAAHRTLPFNTYVRVTNLANGRRLVVRINDRGPFLRGRIIDLSYTAAKILDIPEAGTSEVRLEVLEADKGARICRRQSDMVRRKGVKTWSAEDFDDLASADKDP